MELKVIINPIAGAGPAKRLLSNLFYGCGYNFYRCERQLRTDDLLIRGKLRQLLVQCRSHLMSLELAFRRAHRAQPEALPTAQALLRARRDLELMEMAVRTATATDMGHIHRRHREERGILEKLVALDGEVLLALVTLRDSVMRLDDGAAAAAAMGKLLRASDFIVLWSRRESLLAGESA